MPCALASTFIVGFAAAMSAASAQEQAITLKPRSGLDKVQTNCSTCHSLDYIPMNSPFLDAAGWNAEVMKSLGASIPFR